jgi:general secretion pathway protein D
VNGVAGAVTSFLASKGFVTLPATNALVISAAPQDYETLKAIVDQLDVPRRQVFVQAIILEVSAQHERDLGINFQSGTNISSSVLGVGQLNFGQLQNALTNPLGLTGLSLGLTSNSNCSVPAAALSAATSTLTSTTTTTTGNVTIPCDVALITALASDTHSNVLSAPTLLTADNQEATIVVGENLPFVSSALASGALANNIFNSVDRQNVGITLDIIPQVTEGDYVRMDLYEEVSSVVGGTQNSTLGPTTTIRSASTTVLVQDHRTTVIGGLMADDTSFTGQGVPFFSSIPVLGNLFNNTSRTSDKTNLIVFLTPHVIRSRQDLRDLSLDERQKFLKNIGKKEVHDMPATQLRQLYKPTWSISVPPSADLGGSSGAPEGTQGGEPPAPAPNPLNTEEINPSSRNDKGLSTPPAIATGVEAPPRAEPPPPAISPPAGSMPGFPAAATGTGKSALAGDSAATAASGPSGAIASAPAADPAAASAALGPDGSGSGPATAAAVDPPMGLKATGAEATADPPGGAIPEAR